MSKRDRDNLNPRPPAVFAMYHWSADYAEQGGGVTDFFNALHPADQKFCHDAVTHILNAALAYGVNLKTGKEPQQKLVPRLKRKRKP